MIRFLIRVAVYFVSAFIGLVAADLLLSGLSIEVSSYFTVAIIFALIQAIISPLVFKMTAKNANAFIGGVGLLSVFVSLLITNILLSGITVSGFSTWILASLIIWLVTAIAAFILPFIFAKNVVEERRN